MGMFVAQSMPNHVLLVTTPHDRRLLVPAVRLDEAGHTVDTATPPRQLTDEPVRAHDAVRIRGRQPDTVSVHAVRRPAQGREAGFARSARRARLQAQYHPAYTECCVGALGSPIR